MVSPIPKYWEEYFPLTSSLRKKIFNETIPRTSKIHGFLHLRTILAWFFLCFLHWSSILAHLNNIGCWKCFSSLYCGEKEKVSELKYRREFFFLLLLFFFFFPEAVWIMINTKVGKNGYLLWKFPDHCHCYAHTLRTANWVVMKASTQTWDTEFIILTPNLAITE